ncbi:hypothetical protein ACGVWS_07945 [Enterobacteriaceae bacterium LUAb1]
MSGVFGARLLKKKSDKYIIWYPVNIKEKEVLLHYNIYLANNPTEIRDPNHVSSNANNVKIDEVNKDNTQWKIPERYEGRGIYISAVFTDKETGQIGNMFPVYVSTSESEPDIHNVKYPEWFKKLSQNEQSELLDNKSFNSWLITTPELASNFTHVYRDNKNVSWRNEGRVLFHGDEMGREPDEIFIMGMRTYNCVYGLMTKKQDSLAGDIVSYSNNYSLASYYSRSEANPEKNYGYVYLVVPGDTTKYGLNVDEGTFESEVAYLSGVRYDYILGCIIINFSDNKIQDFLINKNCTQYQEINKFVNDARLKMVIFSCDPGKQLKLAITKGIKLINYVDESPELMDISGKIRFVAVSKVTEKSTPVTWKVNGEKITVNPDFEINVDDYFQNRLIIIEAD